MAQLSPEKIFGTKFEIWLEQLFSERYYWPVRRNIEYHRSQYVFRQADLEYRDLHPLNSLVLVEAKYSSNGVVHGALREEKRKNGQLLSPLDNIVIELEERRRFIKARKALLITNRFFGREVYQEAKKYPRIKVYDCRCLEKLDEERRGLLSYLLPRKSIEEQIHALDLRKYDLSPKIVYI